MLGRTWGGVDHQSFVLKSLLLGYTEYCILVHPIFRRTHVGRLVMGLSPQNNPSSQSLSISKGVALSQNQVKNVMANLPKQIEMGLARRIRNGK